MAKFGVGELPQPSGGTFINPGVVDRSGGSMGALANVANVAAKGYMAYQGRQDDLRAAELQKQQQLAAADFAGNLVELEQQEAGINQELAGIQEQIYNEEDVAKIQKLRSQYTQLAQSERIGANPTSIAARRRSMLRQFMAENPGLTQDALSIAGKVDGFGDVGVDAEGDAVLAVNQELMTKALRGIPVAAQLQAVQDAHQLEDAQTKLSVAKLNGEVNVNNYVGVASAEGLTLGNDFMGQVITQLTALDEQTGAPGVQNLPEFKAQVHAQFGSMVNSEMARIRREAQSDGIIFSPEQLGQIRTSLEGNTMSILEPILSQRDPEKIKEQLEHQDKITTLMGASRYREANPVLSRMTDQFGNEQGLKLFNDVARATTLIERRGVEQARQAAIGDPSLAGALRIIDGGGLPAFLGMAMEDPDKGTGNPQLDVFTTTAAAKVMADGTLNAEGNENSLTHIFNSGSNSAVRELMSDKMISQVRSNPQMQRDLENFSANKSQAIFGPMMDIIEDEGINITFTQVPPTRGGAGSRRTPAEAFTITVEPGKRVSMDVAKKINKLNALYTLMGTYSSPEQLAAFGEEMSGLVDRDSPKFIENHSRLMVQRHEDTLTKQRQELADLRAIEARQGGTGSIYDAPEERAANLQRSLMRKTAQISATELMIESERMRVMEVTPEQSMGKLPTDAETPQEPTTTKQEPIGDVGMDMGSYLDQLAMVESSGNPTAKAKTSSASGLFQFIESTWLETVKKYEPELAKGISREELLELRFDPEVSTRMAQHFTEENASRLERSGIPVTQGNLYLAHFAGPSTAKRLLTANFDSTVDGVFSDKAIKANPGVLSDRKGNPKTVGEVVDWAAKKFGETPPSERMVADAGTAMTISNTNEETTPQEPPKAGDVIEIYPGMWRKVLEDGTLVPAPAPDGTETRRF